MRRVANTQTVNSQSAVFVLVGCKFNIAIVEVVIWAIPVPTDVFSVRWALLEKFTHVLSNPIPWVSTCTAGLVRLLTVGLQNCALML